MACPLGERIGKSLGQRPAFAIGTGPSDVPRYAAGGVLLPVNAHEFVNKGSIFQTVRAALTRRKNGPHTTTLSRFAARVMPV
jgi:hypothetical protein